MIHHLKANKLRFKSYIEKGCGDDHCCRFFFSS